MAGKFYLIPTTISSDWDPTTIPAYLPREIAPLRVFFAEHIPSAQRFLKKVCPAMPLEECRFFSLNEHTSARHAVEFFKETEQHDAGILSESGCPGIADPGAEIVALAHQYKREVVPLVGPSSVVLALMASGLCGQNFAFHGYLPKERQQRIAKLKQLEKRSAEEGQTQIFIEAPYRNHHVFEDILLHCQPGTSVCVAYDLMGPEQRIQTTTVREWKTRGAVFSKKPAVFLLQSGNLGSRGKYSKEGKC